MVVHPRVEVKPVEAHARLAEWNLGQVWAHVALKDPVADPEIGSRLCRAEEARG